MLMRQARGQAAVVVVYLDSDVLMREHQRYGGRLHGRHRVEAQRLMQHLQRRLAQWRTQLLPYSCRRHVVHLVREENEGASKPRHKS